MNCCCGECEVERGEQAPALVSEDIAMRAVALAVLEERWRCIHAVCPHCKDGDKPVLAGSMNYKHGSRLCRASEIHARSARAGGR